MIRDQLVEKTNNKKVLETLLSTPNLTLEKAVEIASRIESTTVFMQQINTTCEKDSFKKIAVIKQNSNKPHVNIKDGTSGNEVLDYSVANREKPYFILGRYA
ncbi:hypothetical protein NDU88_004412 [Pleurodeles waltl]|uniref:Uncharacterized protein n=1 Tax=Pleurodeles waltl TaxID=8319 RepID=A0AAV7NNC9_PLEWA|nr:hypothetical protein NDU88_004412 [Pleurodeles waltl]